MTRLRNESALTKATYFCEENLSGLDAVGWVVVLASILYDKYSPGRTLRCLVNLAEGLGWRRKEEQREQLRKDQSTPI